MAGSKDLIRAMSGDDLGIVLAWRNAPNVRKFMYSQAEISGEEHRRWFGEASRDPSTHLLIFETGGKACGYSKLSQWRGGPVAEWGFYTAPDAQKGVGTRLGIATLNHAFDDLKLSKVFAQTLEFNTHALAYNEKMGFTREGILRDHFFDGVAYHSVHCFGLLAQEWQRICERKAWK